MKKFNWLSAAVLCFCCLNISAQNQKATRTIPVNYYGDRYNLVLNYQYKELEEGIQLMDGPFSLTIDGGYGEERDMEYLMEGRFKNGWYDGPMKIITHGSDSEETASFFKGSFSNGLPHGHWEAQNYLGTFSANFNYGQLTGRYDYSSNDDRGTMGNGTIDENCNMIGDGIYNDMDIRCRNGVLIASTFGVKEFTYAENLANGYNDRSSLEDEGRFIRMHELGLRNELRLILGTYAPWNLIPGCKQIDKNYYFSEVICPYRIEDKGLSWLERLILNDEIPYWQTNNLEQPNYAVMMSSQMVSENRFYFPEDTELEDGMCTVYLTEKQSAGIRQTFYEAQKNRITEALDSFLRKLKKSNLSSDDYDNDIYDAVIYELRRDRSMAEMLGRDFSADEKMAARMVALGPVINYKIGDIKHVEGSINDWDVIASIKVNLPEIGEEVTHDVIFRYSIPLSGPTLLPVFSGYTEMDMMDPGNRKLLTHFLLKGTANIKEMNKYADLSNAMEAILKEYQAEEDSHNFDQAENLEEMIMKLKTITEIQKNYLSYMPMVNDFLEIHNDLCTRHEFMPELTRNYIAYMDANPLEPKATQENIEKVNELRIFQMSCLEYVRQYEEEIVPLDQMVRTKARDISNIYDNYLKWYGSQKRTWENGWDWNAAIAAQKKNMKSCLDYTDRYMTSIVEPNAKTANTIAGISCIRDPYTTWFESLDLNWEPDTDLNSRLAEYEHIIVDCHKYALKYNWIRNADNQIRPQIEKMKRINTLYQPWFDAIDFTWKADRYSSKRLQDIIDIQKVITDAINNESLKELNSRIRKEKITSMEDLGKRIGR